MVSDVWSHGNGKGYTAHRELFIDTNDTRTDFPGLCTAPEIVIYLRTFEVRFHFISCYSGENSVHETVKGTINHF